MQAATALGKWQKRELRIARGFIECRGLTHDQLEEIYQETVVALYSRPYASEEHLQNALRMGIKQRALRLYRDERRRAQILARNAPALRAKLQSREEQNAPESAVVAHEDRLVATEFLAELTALERSVFGWLVEGLQYRAIASTLGIAENEARNAVRACERKRERFQLLYDTGRMCGYRARTIQALRDGQCESNELAQRAFAHLESCVSCRLEHKTDAKRLRRGFRENAAVLLPPILLDRLGRIARAGVRVRRLAYRLGFRAATGPGTGARERAVALLTNSAPVTKITVAVATVGVLSGGAVGSHVLAQHAHSDKPARRIAPALAASPRSLGTEPARPADESRPVTRQTSAARRRTMLARSNAVRRAGRRSPGPTRQGGFAYLGVPTTTSAPARGAAQSSAAEPVEQHSGGPFSP